MSDADRIVDARVMEWAAATLRRTPRWVNGVWRDRPWRYVEWRAWVYNDGRGFAEGGSGLSEVRREIGIEACFPVTRPPDGAAPSDIEPLGDIILAELEDALCAASTDIAGIEDAMLTIVADDVHPIVRPNDQSGRVLARAVLVIGVTYTRGRGNPYSRNATTW